MVGLSPFTASGCAPVTDLDLIDAEFRVIISPIQLKLNTGDISMDEAAILFSTLLRTHLDSYGSVRK